MKVVLLTKAYDGEELCDVGRDVYEALEDADVPVDEHGFVAGKVHIVITFEPADQHKGFAQPKGDSDE